MVLEEKKTGVSNEDKKELMRKKKAALLARMKGSAKTFLNQKVTGSDAQEPAMQHTTLTCVSC